MKKQALKTILPIVMYSILGLILVAAIVLTLGSAFNADYARLLERFVIRDLDIYDFDLFVVGQWVIIGTAAILTTLFVLGDERHYRRNRKSAR